MTLVRTTLRPWEDLDVTDAERWHLIRHNILADYYGYLTARFYLYEGGPLVDVVDVTITLALEGAGVLAGLTSTGVEHVSTGTYGWAWPDYEAAAPGEYTATWDAADSTDMSVQAVETFTLEASARFRAWR